MKLVIATISLLLTVPAKTDEIAELRKQIELLSAKIDMLEQQRQHQEVRPTVSEDETTPPIAVMAGSNLPGSFILPGTSTSMSISGFIQTTLIHDIGPRPTSRGGDVASVHAAVLEDTPEYQNRGDTRFTSRNTRLTIATETPTSFGRIRTTIEGDFNGPPNNKASRATTSRTAFGIRHAYGEVGNFLIGHYWTNFSDNSVFPRKVDGTGPTGRTFMRQGQLRYTHRFDGGKRFAIALENPRGDFENADDDNLHDGLPDLTAHYRHQTDRWHMQFSGMLRQIGINDGIQGGARDNVTSWGLNHSAAFLLPNSMDRISWYLIAGDGIGRYMDGGVDQGASITQDGKLDTQFGYGGFVTYKHWWTDTLHSNVDFGIGYFSLNPDTPADTNKRLYSSHMNLMWTPIEQLEFGIEYVWAHRKVYDGREGKINRVNATSIFYF